MLQEMKGFNTCLLISGHIKEDQGVPGRNKQPEEETRKNLLSKQRGMETSGSLSERRGEGEDKEEAVTHPGLPMNLKLISSRSGRTGSSDGEPELLKKKQQGVS